MCVCVCVCVCACVCVCVCENSKKNFFFFFEIGIFFSNWEKSHLNPIGKGAEFRPLRTPKKIPDNIPLTDMCCTLCEVHVHAHTNKNSLTETVLLSTSKAA